MTKSFHYCDECEGINGKYIKVCRKTGKEIETFNEQYDRIAKGLLDDKNYVEPDGSKQ